MSVSGSSFGWGPNVATLGVVVYDPPTRKLRLAVRVTNLGNRTKSFIPDLSLKSSSGSISLTPAPGETTEVIVGLAQDITYGADGVAAFDAGASELVVGAASENQQIVPLGPKAPDPTHVTLPRTIANPPPLSIGRWTMTPTVTSVLPGSPRGTSSAAGEAVLVLRYDLHSSAFLRQVYGFDSIGFVRLRRPDGVVVQPIDGSDAVTPLTNSDFMGLWAAFTIPESATGKYAVTLQDNSTKGITASDPVKTTEAAFSIDDPAGRWSEPGTAAVPRWSSATNDVKGIERDITGPDNQFAYGGMAVTVRALRTDVTKKQTLIDIDVTNIGQIEEYFAPDIALVFANHTISGIPAKRPRLAPGATTHDTIEYNSLPLFKADDLDQAFLVVGRGDENRPVVPLGPHSPAAPNTQAVNERTVQLSASAGPWAIAVNRIRVGGVRNADKGSAAGTTQIEFTYDLTNNGDSKTSGFNSTSQILLRRPDGRIIEADATDTDRSAEPGQTNRHWTVFQDNAPVGGNYSIVLRSADDMDLRVSGWDQTQIPVQL